MSIESFEWMKISEEKEKKQLFSQLEETTAIPLHTRILKKWEIFNNLKKKEFFRELLVYFLYFI